MVGIFDGHRGASCADYLSQEVPKMIVQGVRDAFAQQLMGAPLDALNAQQEVQVLKSGIIAGLKPIESHFEWH